MGEPADITAALEHQINHGTIVYSGEGGMGAGLFIDHLGAWLSAFEQPSAGQSGVRCGMKSTGMSNVAPLTPQVLREGGVCV